MPHEGEQIGPFTLVKKLGGGSMGIVWLAELGFSKTQCALKMPDSSIVRNEDVIKEAKLWITAGHNPNIVPIIDWFEHNGQILITSEYHPDGSLDKWLEKHGGKAPSLQ